MLFYSIFAVVIGGLFLGFGISHVFFKKTIAKVYENKNIKDINQYLNLEGSTMILCGFILFIGGILSFIVDADLVFSLLFTASILLFFINDIVCRKKLIIQD